MNLIMKKGHKLCDQAKHLQDTTKLARIAQNNTVTLDWILQEEKDDIPSLFFLQLS